MLLAGCTLLATILVLALVRSRCLCLFGCLEGKLGSDCPVVKGLP